MNLSPQDKVDRLLNAADLMLGVLNNSKGTRSLLTLSLDELMQRTPPGSTLFTRAELQEARSFLFRLGFSRPVGTAS